jgi:glucose/mannose-6-phosphate isomerase
MSFVEVFFDKVRKAPPIPASTSGNSNESHKRSRGSLNTMMNLDDISKFKEIDNQNMLAEVDALPGQLSKAYQLGLSQNLPAWDGISNVLITGMGGSAIGADLLASYIADSCPVPVYVLRDYGLPAWARGAGTLVIGSSHSGDTEETLASFEQALQRGCRCLAITTGGKLGELAAREKTPIWKFQHAGQPRAAVGYSFGLLLALLVRLGFVTDPAPELENAVAAMRQQQESLKPDVPAVHNPAKRMAGQLMERWVTVLGSGILAPVARRWKGQMSEVAKAWAQFEFLPEADHNTLAGVVNPEERFAHMMVLFLRSSLDHPRNQLRIELTRKGFMLEGLNTDVIDARGDSPLAHIWTALHFGDYTAYYLAMAYGVDPTPVAAIENLKREMSVKEGG